jgi:opacity protein-like surface antigen
MWKSALLVVASGLLFATAAIAASPIEKQSAISLGVFFNDQDTDTGFSSNFSDREVVLDLEDDLGLDSSLSVFRADGYFRFGEKHRIDGSIFDFSRSANENTAVEIDWKDTQFTANTNLNTNLDLKIYKVSYTYEWIKGDKGYVGVSGGLYIADIDLSLIANDSIDEERGTLTAPLPVVGIRAGRALSERWAARAHAEFFFIDVESLSGHLYDVGIGVDYWFSDRVALGIGWNHVDIDVDATSRSLSTDIDWTYSGGLASILFSFD